MEGSDPDLVWGTVLSWHLPGGTEVVHKNFYSGRLVSGPVIKQTGSSENETGMLATGRRRSITVSDIQAVAHIRSPQNPRRGGAVRQMGPQTYRILKCVIDSFGLDSCFLTQGSVARDLVVTFLNIGGVPPIIESRGAPDQFSIPQHLKYLRIIPFLTCLERLWGRRKILCNGNW
jgi:hypothetical protein